MIREHYHLKKIIEELHWITTNIQYESNIDITILQKAQQTLSQFIYEIENSDEFQKETQGD